MSATDSSALLSTTRRIGADQKLLILLDQRINDLKQLATVYREWLMLTHARTVTKLHGILSGIAAIFVIVLLLLLVDRWLERLLRRAKFDRRQLETLRSITRVALQVLGVLAILLIVVGVPSQLGTMIGLAGAGLDRGFAETSSSPSSAGSCSWAATACGSGTGSRSMA